MGPLWLSLKLAACVAVLLLVIGMPIAYWLAQTTWRGKFLLEAVVALPLVLPPTVLGFYALLAMGPRGSGGKILERRVRARFGVYFWRVSDCVDVLQLSVCRATADGGV